MAVLVAVPFGGMLGGVAAATGALLSLGKTESAAWLSLGGGVLIAVLVLPFFYFWVMDRPGDLKDFVVGLINPTAGCPLVWAVVLIGWGVSLLRRP